MTGHRSAPNAGGPLRVAVLGATGMLGHTLIRRLIGDPGLEVHGLQRSRDARNAVAYSLGHRLATGVDARDFDKVAAWMAATQPHAVVNCIGVIKQAPAVLDPVATVDLNGVFPHRLAEVCETQGARLIHISTDCVFSGSRGGYSEEDVPDPVDLYGRSKLVGEPTTQSSVTLRTSIIGHEQETHRSLVDWFLTQAGQVGGYTRAIYSGLPTIELADLIATVILRRPDLAGLYHVASAPISKFDLLTLVQERYGWEGVLVPDDAVVCDRSMIAHKLWRATGYAPPSWPDMIDHMFRDGQSEVRV